eukprot:scpid30385/ scgid30688/ 
MNATTTPPLRNVTTSTTRRESQVPAVGSTPTNPSSLSCSTNSRVSWASKLQKSLTNSLGISSSPMSTDDGSPLKPIQQQCIHQVTVDILMLPSDAMAPYTAVLQDCLWREKCTLSLERVGSDLGFTDLEDRPTQQRPYVLVTQLDRKSLTQGKRRISEDSLPPAVINLEDITAIQQVNERVLESRGQHTTYACVIEALVKSQSLFFAAQRLVKQCIRFVYSEDLVEWVATLKSALALCLCNDGEIPSLYHVRVPSHQRVVAQQHALLVITPAKPRPLCIRLLHPLSMVPLYEVTLTSIYSIGQRFDVKQLWLSIAQSPQSPLGMSIDLSLHCQCVGLLVKAIKAALHYNLDWGEEIVTNTTSTFIHHSRQRAPSSISSNPDGEPHRRDSLVPERSSLHIVPSPTPASGNGSAVEWSGSVVSVEGHDRMLTPYSSIDGPPDDLAYSNSSSVFLPAGPDTPTVLATPGNTLELDGTPGQQEGTPVAGISHGPPVRPPKPGRNSPSQLLSDNLLNDDDFGEMTDMKPSAFVEFAEIPDAAQLPSHPEMRRFRMATSNAGKCLTLPLPPKQRSISSTNIIESIDDMDESRDRVVRLSRSNSVPDRRSYMSKVNSLSNRARLLPDDTLDLDEVSLLSDSSVCAPGEHTDQVVRRPTRQHSQEEVTKARGISCETVYIGPPLAIFDRDSTHLRDVSDLPENVAAD